MSDLDYGRPTRDAGKTPDKSFLTSLSDELMVALQQSKTADKKQSKPASNHTVRTEHKAPIRTSTPANLNIPVLAPQLQTKPAETPASPRTNLVDASRSIVDSAVSLLRAGIQRVSEVHLRTSDSAAAQSASHDTIVKTELSKVAAQSSETEKLAVISHRAVSTAATEGQNKAIDKNTAVTSALADLSIDYGQVPSPIKLPAKESVPTSALPTVIATASITDSTKPTTESRAANEMSRPSQNINLAQGAAHTISASDASNKVSTPQTLRPIEDTFSKVLPRNDNALKDTRVFSEQSRNLTGTVTVAGATDASKPGINVAINVRSFSVDGKPKQVLPGNLINPQTPILRSMQPQLGPMYRAGTHNVLNGELDASETKSRFNSTNLTPSDKRYTLGTEIALVALTAAAGASRRRLELTEAERRRQEEERRKKSTGEDSTVSEDQVIATTRKRPTMLIGHNDNLVRIAENRLDDANLGWLIAQLNRDVSNQVELDGKFIVEFESRQEIVLPVWDDIVEFYEANRGPFDNRRLITIVKQTEIDQELLEATLGPLFNS